MLEYEEDIHKQIEGQSFLLVMGGGLNIQSAINRCIDPYLNANSFVLLINFGDEDKEFVLGVESPHMHNVGMHPRKSRTQMYQTGGVYVAGSRVFISDMLDGTIDAKKVNCLIICNAETMTEASPESFIIHIFRSKNADGHIKAFSESPVHLALGFSPLAKKLRCLKVSKVLFFPRFHSKVEKSLNTDLDIEEIKFKMPKKVGEIQVVLMEIIDSLLKLVLKGNDRDQINSGMIISGNIYRIFKHLKILPVNNTWNNGSGSVIDDLCEMKTLVFFLFSCDPGSLYKYVGNMVKRQIELGKNSTWLNLDASHVLVDKARELFHDAIQKSDYSITCGESILNQKHKRIDIQNEIEILQTLPEDALKIFYRLNPKMNKLLEIIEQSSDVRMIILVSNNQVKDSLLSVFALYRHVNNDECASLDTIRVLTHHEFKYDTHDYECAVLFESSQDSIRKIERYGTTHSIKAYFLMYSNSLEEHRYLEEIRMEKQCFEKLIEERSRLPLCLDNLEDQIDLEDECIDRKYTVVVDSRELRAELPFFLFRTKNVLHVSTLSIGDYLLSPSICIERKSIADFQSSLSSGRLYAQASMMCYRYAFPILLLEFDGRPCLSDYYRYEQDTFRNSILCKFVLLLFNFGTLRVVWSDCRLFSVKVIRDLQRKECLDEVQEMEVGMNPELVDVLLSIPGITQFNIWKVRKGFRSLRDLAFSTMERLKSVLGEKISVMVHKFFRQAVVVSKISLKEVDQCQYATDYESEQKRRLI
ncbi:ERCC4-type nuclease [Ordospora colligata]|uniref:ERCC4-type nuclease n=1 Tax=Ordospora colligata OC4 TaxID=1354746 RepID=A0A0B2UIG5_9MICR|nr:ERCC4-type nuclease [Ordospora colligata OC4]KHN69148.1 ERCC4-type nuclease [Ordospora colligata OC4]TBU14797.1 ERCC4-type nuclease [Ordospora colligata]TBU18120.1 ERCC4-type nuclease [Ordospora colligata]